MFAPRRLASPLDLLLTAALRAPLGWAASLARALLGPSAQAPPGPCGSSLLLFLEFVLFSHFPPQSFGSELSPSPRGWAAADVSVLGRRAVGFPAAHGVRFPLRSVRISFGQRAAGSPSHWLGRGAGSGHHLHAIQGVPTSSNRSWVLTLNAHSLLQGPPPSRHFTSSLWPLSLGQPWGQPSGSVPLWCWTGQRLLALSRVGKTPSLGPGPGRGEGGLLPAMLG